MSSGLVNKQELEDLKKQFQADMLEDGVKFNNKIKCIQDDIEYHGQATRSMEQQRVKDNERLTEKFNESSQVMAAIMDVAMGTKAKEGKKRRYENQQEDHTMVPYSGINSYINSPEKKKSFLQQPGASNVESRPTIHYDYTKDAPSEVAQFLEENHLTELIPIFANENIGMDTLMSLTEEDASNIGVKFRARKKLMEAIQRMKSTALYQLFSKFDLTEYVTRFVAENITLNEIKGMTDNDLDDFDISRAARVKFNQAKNSLK